MSELSRRSLLTGVGRGAVAAGLAGLTARGAWLSLSPHLDRGASDAGLGRELRIGYLPITDASALLLAHELGYFKAAGVPSARPVMFRSWEALTQAFIVGEVDVIHLLMPFAVQLRLGHRTPIKILSWGHTNGSALTVLPGITRTEQLAGTTVAIPYWWSIHSALTQRVLTSAGLRPVIRQTASARAGTVELVVMPPAEMVSALAAGSISGYAVADPFCAVAEVKGIGHVHRFLGDVWRDHACCVVTVKEKLVAEQPAVAQGITDAVVAAQAWLEGNRDRAAEELTTGAGFLPQPTPAVDRVLTRTTGTAETITRNAGWHGERLGFTAFPQPGYTAALVETLRTTLIDGDTSFLPDDPAQVHDDLVADRFVRKSLAAAGQPITTRTEEIAP